MFNPQNTFKILCLTGSNLGYKENDRICQNDSFALFEEALQIAEERKVDFILHCGNFFYSEPSKETQKKALQIIRKVCFGERKVGFSGFKMEKEGHDQNQSLNFHDPNFQIKIPIFVIHGNFEINESSPLDIFSEAKYINYFGQLSDLDSSIQPIKLLKGSTKLNLFGLGFHPILDQQSTNTSRNNSIFNISQGDSQAFNLFAIHSYSNFNQNILDPKSNFGSSQNLVLFGSESGFLNNNSNSGNLVTLKPSLPVELPDRGLSDWEENRCMILEISDNKFKIESIKFENFRKFFYNSIPSMEKNELYNLVKRECQYIKRHIPQKTRSFIFPPKFLELPLARIDITLKGNSGDLIRINENDSFFSELIANPDSAFNFIQHSFNFQDESSVQNREQNLEEIFQKEIRSFGNSTNMPSFFDQFFTMNLSQKKSKNSNSKKKFKKKERKLKRK
eukprot:Anaeramoba_ignava/a617045_8.p1 GENE.a617045_8~~a617045_8.p1  ORF type:complete len:449 (-),score=159.81 a617045_8:113-1459(-)